jgi:hypothetical protein
MSGKLPSSRRLARTLGVVNLRDYRLLVVR